MKQIEVTILGQNYVLGCPPGSEQPLRTAVSHVDREMTAIRAAGKVRARERIAVLAALNLAFALTGQSTEQAPADEADGSAVDVDGLIRRVDQALLQRGELL